MDFEGRYYQANGVWLHVVEAGPQEAPVLMLLHGFPEFWYGWKNQIGFFAGRGFRVVVPDQRGYNRSNKPSRIKAYSLDYLTNDIAALIPQITDRKVFLAGHDWGGAVAWDLALRHPHLLEKLIVLNLPHPQVMRSFLRKNPRQMLRSWYAGFFQFPLLPELTCRAFNYRLLAGAMVNTATPGTFSREDIGRYKAAWRQPGALRAMINWYRAYKYNSTRPKGDIRIPVLLLWGKKDAFLIEEMAQPSIARCRDGQLVMIEGATHWLHHEKADQVNDLMLDFIRRR
jgi:pimeloyl-ACP methyl ester carboxylesterase